MFRHLYTRSQDQHATLNSRDLFNKLESTGGVENTDEGTECTASQDHLYKSAQCPTTVWTSSDLWAVNNR